MCAVCIAIAMHYLRFIDFFGSFVLVPHPIISSLQVLEQASQQVLLPVLQVQN